MIEMRGYIDRKGRAVFKEWFDELDAAASAKVAIALTRMELGNFSNAKGVGSSVLEYRIDWGAGYRIYFAKDGDALIILLAGGTKRRQDSDIETALSRWADYKLRKKGT